MSSSKILIICTRYSVSGEDPYLTDDLINEMLVERDVVVLAIGNIIDEDVSRVVSTRGERLHVFLVPHLIKNRFVKYLVLWPSIFLRLIQIRFHHPDIKSIIAFGPLLPIWPAIAFLDVFRAKKLCVIFDIFPLHQSQIGAVPKLASDFLRLVEIGLLSRFNMLTGMTPANVSLIESYYGMRGHVYLLPLWGSYRVISKLDNLNEQVGKGTIKLIFGGQITFGRDFEILLKLLLELRKMHLPIEVDIFSSGEKYQDLKNKYSQERGWLKFRNKINREKYRTALAEYDIGLVVTDADVSVPTFPSKIIDYLSAGIKVLCLLEKTSDVAEVISNTEAVFVNNFDLSQSSINKMAEFVESSSKRLDSTTVAKFVEKFSAKLAVTRINELLLQ